MYCSAVPNLICSPSKGAVNSSSYHWEKIPNGTSCGFQKYTGPVPSSSTGVGAAAAEDEDGAFDELAFLLGFGAVGVKLVNCCPLDLLVIRGIAMDWAVGMWFGLVLNFKRR
jgi:hypothetical protein